MLAAVSCLIYAICRYMYSIVSQSLINGNNYKLNKIRMKRTILYLSRVYST